MSNLTDNLHSGSYTRAYATARVKKEADDACARYEQSRRLHRPCAAHRRAMDETNKEARCIIAAAQNPSITAYGWVSFSD